MPEHHAWRFRSLWLTAMVVVARGRLGTIQCSCGGVQGCVVETERIGPSQSHQTGDRVFLFLFTDDFWRDYTTYCERGVEFVRLPAEELYGTVAVFRDPLGNQWDLIKPRRLST